MRMRIYAWYSTICRNLTLPFFLAWGLWGDYSKGKKEIKYNNGSN